MGFRKISDDLKRTVVFLKNRGRDTPLEICDATGIHIRTYYRVLKQFRCTGDVLRPPAVGRGRPRRLLEADAAYLVRLSKHNCTLFLDEYQHRIDVKRLEKMAKERDPMKRADFLHRIGQYPPHYLLCIDEVSKDDRTYGLALGKGIVAAQAVEGSFDKEKYIAYLQDVVVPSYYQPISRSSKCASYGQCTHSSF
ncbi:hypothetical protein C8J56DRAFT_1005027 [Mycena floridula]|nr:hypothetical protein C8J56DRAFT_1005027 [Mycena floridula]